MTQSTLGLVSTAPFTARQRLTLLATSIGLFMIFLDATIVNVALPDIAHDFDAGEQGIQWVVAAYSLTMGMFIMSAATLCDRLGRRRMLIAGTVLFAAASALCAAAPTLLVLNLGRGLQGVGAAVVNVASLALVSAAFPDSKAKARAIGLWTAVASVGLAIGPTVGGFLTEASGWRSIFLVNVVIGAVGIVLVRAFVDESRDPTVRNLDLPGQLLFIAAVGALTYALIEGPHTGWTSPLIVALLVAASILGTGFVLFELRTADPMMDVRVFRDEVYSVAIVTLFVVMFSVYGLLLVVTQYFQNVEAYSPERAGVLMLAYTVPTIVFAPIAGALTARGGGRGPTLAGVALLAAGLVVIATGIGGTLAVLLVGLMLTGTAAGLAIAPTTNVAMASVSASRSGMASGIMSAQRALGSTAGFAVMGSVLAAVVAATLPSNFTPLMADPPRQQVVQVVVDDANPRAVASLIGPGKPLPDEVAQTAELVDAADDSFVAGIRSGLAVAVVLVLVALVAGYRVFPRGPSPRAAKGAMLAR